MTARATMSLLGRVPATWQVAPLRVAGEFFGGGTPDTGNPSFWEGDIPWLSSQDVRGRWVRATSRAITKEGLNGSSARMARCGDMVFVMRSGILRHTLPSAIVGTDMAINQDIKVLRLRGPWIAEYLSYVVTGLQTALLARWRSEGTTVESLDLDLMRRTVFPVPPEREQRAIADFLNRETDGIDSLVAKKQRLIGLLEEKRAALISHAVTKGLDLNVPMKDAGIGWLGSVPVHWSQRPLKSCIKPMSTISYGIVQPGEPLDAGVPFVQTTNISGELLDISHLQNTSSEIAAAYPRTILREGDVLLGIRASVGAAHVVPRELDGCNLSRGVARIETGVQLLPQFLVLYLRSSMVREYWGLMKEGSTYEDVSIAKVRMLPVPLPPSHEQRDIVRLIVNETRSLDELIGRIAGAAACLGEYRAALITAAVTGQIDVRAYRRDPEEALEAN